MNLSVPELSLIDQWQRNFPLVERPFEMVGRSIGLDEEATIATFERLIEHDVISRIGAVVRPNTVGASTLAAMSVELDSVERVAAIVNSEPLVTHNYERNHALNLWFVVAGPQPDAVASTIGHIARRAGLPVVDLPLSKAYHLDLGFSLSGAIKRTINGANDACYQPDGCDRRVLAAIEDGIPLAPYPYREIGQRIGADPGEVIDRLRQLMSARIVSRFGCVVRHRKLGYVANAMAVWDVPDDLVDEVASRFIQNPQVTLCYRRPRRPPHWPYNLFCMIHAKTREEALATIADLNAVTDSSSFDQSVLFSTRCFKQRGAVFSNHALEAT